MSLLKSIYYIKANKHKNLKSFVEAYLLLSYEGRSKTEDYMHGLKGLIRASSQKDLIKNIFKPFITSNIKN